MSTSTRSYTSAPVTQPVPVSLFAENRARLVARLAPATGILLVKGGEQKEQYDTDREVLFRQESNFYWLTGCHDPDAMFAMDVATGESTIFIKHLPEAYAVWYGTIESPETAAKRLGIQHGQYTKDLPHWFKGKKPSTIHVLKGTNSDRYN
jgi:Xaa-Pro dipeptidase